MSSNNNDLTGVIIKHSQAGAPLAVTVALKFLANNKDIKLVPKKDQEGVELQAVPLGETVKGEVATLRYLARWAPNNSLYGADPFTGTLVDCWIDFALTQLPKQDSPVEGPANELNTHLQLRTFLADYRVTIGDIYVWSALKRNTNWEKFTQSSQKQLPHLFRWFNHLSSLPQFSQPETKKKDEKPVAAPGSAPKLNLGAMGNFDALELPGASEGNVVTRFPPEPSGYLHIGHAKAALLNNHYASRFKGKMIVRFDDTNPSKEKVEYVESIIQDLGTLGIKASRITYTSDYFDKLLEFAEKFIKDGNAYVDDSPVEVMRKNRWDGIPSAARDLSIEENLKLWQEMKEGTEHGQKCVLRAKIDMSNPNKALRDPTIYRYVGTHHHKTGDKFKIYPIYDFACPIVDSLEGVTHALRSSEYHDRNPLYYWIVDAAGLKRPCIQDFARLTFAYVLLSKRKLQWFVDNGKVSGWNDPRMPTIQGVLRRGLTLDALREFVLSQGASKAITLMDMEKLWAVNKKVIDPVVPRYTAIAKQGKALFHLSGAPDAPVAKSVPRHKKNPDLGNKVISLANKIYLEAEDAKLIKEGEEVTLMDWGNAIVEKITTDANGQITLNGRLHLEGNFKTTEKKLTWVAVVDDLIDVQLVEYDHLITKSKLDEGDNFIDFVNPKSQIDTPALGDPNMRNLNKGDKLQLERRGYFIVDEPLVFGNKPLVLVKIPDGKQDPKKEQEKKPAQDKKAKAQEKKQ